MRYKDCGSLSLKELISITLRESNDSPVVEELLQRFSTVSDLYRASVYELTTIKGLGLARANALKASLELGRRLFTVQPEQLPSIRSPQDVANLLMNEMRYLDREHFRVLLLCQNRVLSIETVSVGTLNSSAVHPRSFLNPPSETVLLRLYWCIIIQRGLNPKQARYHCYRAFKRGWRDFGY